MFNWFRKETQLVLVTIEMVQEKLNLKNEVLKLKSELHEAHESIARLRTMHDKVYKENKGLKKSYPTFKSLLELGIDKTAELVNKELVEENETLRQAYQTLNPDVYCKNILDELSEEKLHNDRQTGLILNLEKKIQSLKDKHDTLEHWIKGLFDMVQYDKADKTPYKDAVQAMEFIRENYGDLLDCCTKQEETIANITKPVMPDKTGIIKGNCDGEMILQAMIEYNNYDKAIMVTSDGDFSCLVKHLRTNKKLGQIIVPRKTAASTLLKMYANKYIIDVQLLRGRLEFIKK